MEIKLFKIFDKTLYLDTSYQTTIFSFYFKKFLIWKLSFLKFYWRMKITGSFALDKLKNQ